MTGEEISGPAGPKVARLLYFVGAAFISVMAINKWRDFQRRSVVVVQPDEQQQKQP